VDLPQKELVHHPGRTHDLNQGHPVRGGERRKVALEGDRSEFIEFGLDGRHRRSGRKVGPGAAAGESKGKDHKDSDGKTHIKLLRKSSLMDTTVWFGNISPEGNKCKPKMEHAPDARASGAGGVRWSRAG